MFLRKVFTLSRLPSFCFGVFSGSIIALIFAYEIGNNFMIIFDAVIGTASLIVLICMGVRAWVRNREEREWEQFVLSSDNPDSQFYRRK